MNLQFKTFSFRLPPAVALAKAGRISFEVIENNNFVLNLLNCSEDFLF